MPSGTDSSESNVAKMIKMSRLSREFSPETTHTLSSASNTITNAES